MNRKRAGVAGAVGVTVTGVLVAAVATSAFPSKDDGSGGSGEAATPGATSTAEVTRQTLRETTTVDGTLGHGDTTAVVAGAAGTITAMPGTGAVRKRGQALYRLDDDPVVLLYGTLPAYRQLRSGVEGRDVEQFEKNLAALGYDGFTVDDEFTSATAAAVKEWQEDLGRAETGTVEPAAVVYAPGKVRVDTLSVTRGSAVQPGSTVLKTSGTSRIVQATVGLVDRPYAKVGARVVVELPDGTEVAGRITSARTVTSEEENGPDDSTTATDLAIDVVLADSKAARRFDAAGVDVDLVVATADDALAVPVSALLALAEGGYAVEKVTGAGAGAGAGAGTGAGADTGTRTLVAVETGIYADGLVEITSGDLAEGDTVVVPS